MSKKKVKFMCTAFRDGFQSVYGARVFTDDFIPAVEAARDAGMQYLEAGGGARFQSLYFYCNENAFDMMDRFRQAAGPDANLQTLARGVNVVGLDSQPADMIDLHAKMFKKHGMTTIRNFDALNDVNNLIYSGQAIVNAGLKHQVCVTMMQLPPGCTGAHDPDFYEKVLRDILDHEVPFDSVCFKDASGTSIPSTVYESIKRARKMLPEGTHIHFHTHETAGTSIASYRAALDAGADAIDLSLAPCSGGTSQPDVLSMWHALRGTDYDLDIDIEKVREVSDVFKDCMKDYFTPPEATAVEPLIPWCPMPGGALTANTQMLRDNGIMEKYPDIIKAMKEVVEKGGFGTSVTPVSQFYFQQAFNNVMFGKWKKIAPSYGQMVLGYFGKTPVTPDADVIKLAAEQLELEPVTEPPLERNNADPEKGIGAAKKMLEAEGLETTDENIFIAGACKEKGIAFLKGEATVGVRKIDPNAPATDVPITASASGDYTVSVGGNSYNVKVDGDTAVVNGHSFNVNVSDGSESEASKAAAPAAGGGKEEDVCASMPGSIFKIVVEEGETVEAGQPLVILEAMKMEVPVQAVHGGTVTKILVSTGQQVGNGEALAVMSIA